MNHRILRAPPAPLLMAALLSACAAGCGGAGTEATGGSGGAGGGGAGGGASEQHALRVKVELTEGEQGVEIFAQNGAVAYVAASDLAGKTVWWATTPGGEPVSSATPIEFGSTKMGSDLTAQYQTAALYADGPWEMSLFVSVTGGDPMNGPQAGDLASFDNSPPPEGQPPVTGSSVRMTVDGADASVALDNEYFVQF
jgi:hypothetical protein